MDFISLLSALSVYIHQKPPELPKPNPVPKVEPVKKQSMPRPIENNKVPDIEGWASYYGYESGTVTANGEAFYPPGLTTAHRTLAFNTCLNVFYPATGRAVKVRVNDRGPFVSPRVLDLSEGAAEAIGMKSHGVGYVKAYIVNCR